MRTTFLIAVMLSALLTAAPADAARWVSIGGKAPRNEVDTSSINKTNDGKLRIWHRETYAQPKFPDSGAFSFTRLTAHTEFQCDKRQAATISRSYTAADGSELLSESFDSREMLPITPDSNLEIVFNYACKPRSKPVAKPPEPAPPPPAPVVEVKEVPKKKLKKGQVEPPPPPPHWSYSGATGPEKWGSLGKDFATCSNGQRQSPIDIRRTVRADLPAIEFAYQPVPLSIVDNGHSIKVDNCRTVAASASTAKVMRCSNSTSTAPARRRSTARLTPWSRIWSISRRKASSRSSPCCSKPARSKN